MEDAAIIGSGPAGLAAGIYLARAGVRVTLIAGSLEPGGALMKTGLVENFPGFPEGINGPELMRAMEDQAKSFGVKFINDDAINADLKGEVKVIELSFEPAVSAKTVIIAVGGKYKKLGALGENEFSGQGVSYCATCDGFFFSGKKVAVIGGGDTAISEAIYLSSLASKVIVIHRRQTLRASKILIDKAKNLGNIEYIWDSNVSEIRGGNTGVESIILENVHGSEKREVEVSGVFIAIGHTPQTQIFEGILPLDELGHIITEGEGGATAIKGVFAAGDCADAKYRQAVIAAGAGAKAALEADDYLKGIG